tara:strand:- start:1513 stop:1809 length:297 start_codon:yes stop_codon:yes gene_type:complete
MAKFTATNQPAGNGRPLGSKNKRSQFTDAMTSTALEKLNIALSDGESWAIQLVINRTHPALKAITPEGSLDGDFLKLKMKEISEFDERIAALEQRLNE